MNMVTKKSWEEFRASGLLWFVNTTLHVFGWAIVVEIMDADDTTITNVYPARVKFRGFNEDTNTKGYQKVSQYLKDNVEELAKECEDE